MLSDEKSKILFVDDDVQSLKLYKRKFGSMYDVRIAENGWEALDLLLAEPMDAVISDLRMPEMDGLMLLQKVREMDADILRVIITAYDDYERIMDSLNNGTVTHSFKKPLNDKYLRLVLDESLENKKIKLKNKEIMDTVKVFSKELSDKLKERTEELKEAYRLLDESDRRYKYAIKAAKQGILDWGISNDELILNDVFLENLGYERSDIILRNLEELKNYIHPDQRADFFSDLKQHMKSGNRMEKRVQLMGKSGSYIWLNFIGMVVEWDQKNRPKRFIGACIDISNQLNLEKELLRANAELKLINETKRNFIANVSHELRTPMNSILGFAGLYEESGDAEERVRYVQHIKRAAATLNRVVEDMIAFSAVGND
ncbi:MAG: response regulator, partial [Clostridia bacterium]|nr:response regulator [Clostridia bacterium]